MVTLDSQAPIILFNEITERKLGEIDWKDLVAKVEGYSGISDLKWLGALPPMVEYSEDVVLTRTLNDFTWQVRNHRYVQGLQLGDTRGRTESTALQSNINRILSSASSQAIDHMSNAFWNLITTGESSVCYTGSAFFGTHTIESTTATNLLTPPTPDFTDDLDTAIATMFGFKAGNNVQPYHSNQTGMYVVAPYTKRNEILSVLNSTVVVAGTTIVGTPASQYGITPIFSSYLSGNSWYLIRSTDERVPFIHCSIVDPVLELGVKRYDTDPDNYRVFVDYGVTYGDPRNAIKVKIA